MAGKPRIGQTIEEWQVERETLNESVLELAGPEIKRFFSLDGQTYRDGSLSARTKEMLGLVASLVLRCDDCILYHTIRCHEEGVASAEFREILSVGLIVGGSIVIPHLRRAVSRWEELEEAGRSVEGRVGRADAPPK
ncbi:MAG: carboxymuconolactone decarboxylase family protein [Spirochaetes bacterium]|nr:carboxymuconolactone decarboxylase family protein [Spirochaetota bacterium]